ncbi:MAG: hypothetical protein AB8F65_00370 [Woeseiaceae bacterium]
MQYKNNKWLLGLLACGLAANGTAQLVGADLVDGDSVNLISYDNPSTDAFTSAGDGFQIYTRGLSPTIPFSLADDSISVFPADTLGIVAETDTAPFFGATDTVNGDTSGAVSATWVFDVAGASDMVLSIDFAAMGDFENSDTFDVTYQIDGGDVQTAFSVTIDENIAADYSLASGTAVNLNDPATLQGTVLTNAFQTFGADIAGSGSELAITLTVNTDGGSEAFAIRNIEINSGGISSDVVAFDLLQSANQNLISFSNPFDGAFASAGDGFQIYQRGVSPSIPFSVLDDSLMTFTGDSLGIVDDTNLDQFFGATDTQNGDNSGPVSAVWVFDITGATELGLSIAMGAMGDFESNDSFTWTYSIDGGADAVAFAGTTDEAASLDYTLAGGGVFTLNDPMTLDGTPLSNVLTAFETALSGEGAELTLTLTLQTDGGSEAMAFQNIQVLRNFEGDEPPPVVEAEIFEIQGDGAASPFAGQVVRSLANVVTALGTDGFFMQTPTGRSDGNVDTSDGIYVFTGAAPTVFVGDIVDVEGSVTEFFGFTEFETGSTVTVTGSGADLPAPVVLDADQPSRSPEISNCAIEFECWEGMLVSIAAGTVTAPNQSFGSDPLAEVFIVARDERAFREPGVAFPGLGGSIATYDGNPEVFELDPDKLGLPNAAIAAGSTFSATGVIGFEFGGYELWPTVLNVTDAVLPVAVRERGQGEFTVGSLNMFRLFDSIDDPADSAADGRTRDDVVIDPAEYAVRLDKLARYIVDVLDSPEVLAVQEVEKLGALDDLAAAINALDASVSYSNELIEGNDVGTIDVGFMVRQSVTVDAVTQIGRDDILAFDGNLLNDRPPLLLEARYTGNDSEFPIAVISVHNRSLGGIDSSSSGERVRAKRLGQAQSLAAAIQALQEAEPAINLVVVGDFNAYEFSDGFVDVVGQIQGVVDPTESLLSGDDLVNPDLVNLTNLIAEEERYSFIFRGSAQALDHALISQNLNDSLRGYMYGRGNADAALNLIEEAGTPLRSSDHDGLVVYLTVDQDGDGVADNRDVCPGTVIPETTTSGRVGRLRFTLANDDFVFDRGGDPDQFSFVIPVTTTDTAGCSCNQIIDALDLGNGQRKFGCSAGVLRRWIRSVRD